MIQELDYMRGSIIDDERIKSFIMMARDKSGSEIASVYCTDEGWQVTVSAATSNEVSRLSWETFLNLFHQFSVFVAQENAAMLREYENKNVQDGGES